MGTANRGCCDGGATVKRSFCCLAGTPKNDAESDWYYVQEIRGWNRIKGMKKRRLLFWGSVFWTLVFPASVQAAEALEGQNIAAFEEKKEAEKPKTEAGLEQTDTESVQGDKTVRCGKNELETNGWDFTGTWIGEDTEWQYQLSDGTYLAKSWLFDNGHWYYFGKDGWMLTGKRRIGSDFYYFREDGAMAVGWIYNEADEVWHYAEESGRLKKGWHRGGDAWYWFNSRYEMFSGGNRMIDAHKYYFYENGQLAANQYVGLFYYDENGIRDRRYDMVVKGKRKPEEEEREQITKVMAELPRTWIQKCLEQGWELMYYTDKKYYAAPKTEQGVYYLYYQTDPYYKKLKFTRPEQLPMAFGEAVASMTGNDAEETALFADYFRYLTESVLAQGLPNYFDGNAAKQFGNLFANYCDPELRAEMQRIAPDLLQQIEVLLGLDRSGHRPEEADYLEMSEEERQISGGNGPASEEQKKEKAGPASEAVLLQEKEES